MSTLLWNRLYIVRLLRFLSLFLSVSPSSLLFLSLTVWNPRSGISSEDNSTAIYEGTLKRFLFLFLFYARWLLSHPTLHSSRNARELSVRTGARNARCDYGTVARAINCPRWFGGIVLLTRSPGNVSGWMSLEEKRREIRVSLGREINSFELKSLWKWKLLTFIRLKNDCIVSFFSKKESLKLQNSIRGLLWQILSLLFCNKSAVSSFESNVEWLVSSFRFTTSNKAQDFAQILNNSANNSCKIGDSPCNSRIFYFNNQTLA